MLPCAVAENLNLDVLGAPDIALQKHRGVAECRPRFLARLLHFAWNSAARFDHPHAAPAAAESGLDDQRKSDLPRDRFSLFARGIDRILRARNYRNTRASAPACAPPFCRPAVPEFLRSAR